MVAIIRLSERKTRRWFRYYVHQVYHFRLLFEKEKQKGISPEERKKISLKKESLYRKIKKGEESRDDLQLSREEMKRLTSTIVERTKQGETPEEIIRWFEKKSQI